MGEYIERNRMVKMLNAVYKYDQLAKYSAELYLNAARTTLMLLPGADVEEVKHGHWICHADAGVTECSVCHNGVSEYVEYPRCMFCGATMDEEGEQ